MKRTIAILLVLIIGMVSVFAAPTTKDTAILNLETSITPINYLTITNWETDTFDWTNYTQTETNTTFDPKDAYGKSENPVLAAHLHYKTNNSGAVSITMSATALVNQSNDDIMPYTIKAGNATVTAATANETPSETPVFTISEAGSGGMQFATEEVRISIPGTSDSYSAGSYVATVTFNFMAN